MRRKKSAFIAIILTFVMIVSTCVPTFALNMPETYANQGEQEADLENIAELETGEDTAGIRQDTFEPVVLVNPLYADVVNPEDIEVVQYSEKSAVGSSETLVGSSGEEIPTTEEEFAEAYRKAFDETLGEWGPQFTVQYKVLSDEEISNEQCNEYFNMLADVALENQFIHNGNPTQGDYGLFQYAGQSYGGGLESGYDHDTGKYYLIIYFDTLLTYYTTPEQEAEETAMLSTVMDFLDLDTKTEYGKIKAIYDYICQHVTYDFANLNNDSYDLKYTSYAALMNGTAVCQGYSALFYRMALEAGLDARIVSGYGGDGGAGGGGPHAWNIVRLKGLYYNMDCTWDAGRDPYDYFLKCPDTFDLHARDAEYETMSFHASYPMATTDYVVVPEDLIEVTPIPEPVITIQPVSCKQIAGAKVHFSLEAEGEGLTYQWQFRRPGSSTWNDAGYYNAKTDNLTFAQTEGRSKNTYRCVVTDAYGRVVESDEVSAVLATGPVIVKQPISMKTLLGTAVSFAVEVEGEGLTYQWQFQKPGKTTWANSGLASAKKATLKFKTAEKDIDKKFRCIVTDADGFSVTSEVANLTIVDSPTITMQPEDVETTVGTVVYFRITATGNGLTYQWQYQAPKKTTWTNSSLAGNKTAKLRVAATESRNGGKYRCVVVDEEGVVVTSYSATLTVR